MRSNTLLAGAAVAALAVVSTAAWAAETAAPSTPSNLRSNLTQMLRNSGYTDIRVAPSSFVVRATDDNGNPVVMSISPDQFTEVTAFGATPRHATNQGAADSGAANNDANFVNVPASDDFSSKVIGLGIYNNDNKDIGTIKDIALSPNGREAAYIVSVGGFLGMGGHDVAVDPSAVKVTYNTSDKTWHASMNASADQLRKGPAFKYSTSWSSGRI
ncbi:PRC-barrel domain-containing protein [uncultured Bradyrhizobium sp.]|uniref:PRC-barrel domain-containing protein n=1 Tax=uncultured Bradyrhizobium sp. TaxID=199684 RepID=UPI00261B0F90|nr:PRC-barrel domain-containing protein [uncultured Bradyrhizobium sp.]